MNNRAIHSLGHVLMLQQVLPSTNREKQFICSSSTRPIDPWLIIVQWLRRYTVEIFLKYSCPQLPILSPSCKLRHTLHQQNQSWMPNWWNNYKIGYFAYNYINLAKIGRKQHWKQIQYKVGMKYKLCSKYNHIYSVIQFVHKSCVVNKVQSRFLVKQEAGFYLCCTEQLLEIDTEH